MSSSIPLVTRQQVFENMCPFTIGQRHRRAYDNTLNRTAAKSCEKFEFSAQTCEYGVFEIKRSSENAIHTRALMFNPFLPPYLMLATGTFDEMNKNREAINANVRVLDEHKTHMNESLQGHSQQITDLTSALDSKKAALADRIDALDLRLTEAQQHLLDNINTMRQSIIDTVRSDLQTRIIDATLEDNRLNDRIDHVNRGLNQRIKDAEEELTEKDQQIQNLQNEVAELRRLVQSALNRGALS